MQDLGKISFYNVKVRDSDGTPVNPATEEKQDTIIANQTNGTQKTKLADEYGNEVESTMTNQLKVAELLMLVFS